MQVEYRTAVNQALDVANGPILGKRKPLPQNWMNYSIGRSYFSVTVVMIRAKKQMRAQLSISGVRAKEFFGLLKSQKDAIERELGYPLDWEALPEAQECRVSSCLNDADPEDQADWPRQHQWLAKRMNDFALGLFPTCSGLRVIA
jgi:hypothetical protein